MKSTRLIALTSFAGHEIWVNADHIQYVEATDRGSFLWILTRKHGLNVKQTPGQILAAVYSAQQEDWA